MGKHVMWRDPHDDNVIITAFWIDAGRYFGRRTDLLNTQQVRDEINQQEDYDG